MKRTRKWLRQPVDYLKKVVTFRFYQERKRLKLRRRGSFADSSWLSLALKPFLFKEKAQTLLGVQLLAAVAFGFSNLPRGEEYLSTWNIDQPVQEVLAYDILLPTETTEHTFLIPIAVLNGISQYYHNGHPGLDLRAPLRSDVVAFDSGKVEKIVDSAFGYGRHVYIQHANGIRTLYAHLGLVSVEEGEELVGGDKVGEIGLTGWTTGPHLHFELYVGDKQANPIPYLRKSLELYQKSLVSNKSANVLAQNGSF